MTTSPTKARRCAAIAVSLSLLASAASAQLRPEVTAPASELARGRAERDPLGRVRRASRLAIASPGATPRARAEAFLARFRAELALAPDAELVHLRTIEAHGRHVVRFGRVAFGGLVQGASVVVRMRGEQVDYVSVARASEPLAASPAIDVGRASARALAEIPEAVRVRSAAAGGLPLDGLVEPVAVIDVAGAHLHQRWRVLVGAERVLAAHALAVDALGRIYESNPVVDMDVTSDVELPFLTSRDRLTGRYFRLHQCNAGARGCEPSQTAAADAAGDFLFDPLEPAYDDAFAEVHGYFHANVVAQHFRETHAFEWSCGTESLMRVYVNYTEAASTPYENAAYSPSGGGECGLMLFGQGRTHDFVYDADVVYHEFGHAVVDGTSELGFFVVDGLGVSYDPGAINEGYADYVAATVSGDPDMAEYLRGAGLGGEGALRNLDNDFVCPDDLVGEVHFDGRIFAGAAWDLREALGAAKADALMYATIVAIDMVPTLAEATETLLATADALEADGTIDASDRAMVQSVVEARGLVGCERVVPLDGGATRTGYSGSAQVTGSAGGSIAPVHYRIDVPADAEALNINVSNLTAGGGEYTLHYRLDGPVRFVASRRPPVLAQGTLRPGQTLVRDGDPPLPRCQTLYVAVVTDNLGAIEASLYEVTANLVRSGVDESCEEPDAGPPAVADGGPGGDPDAGVSEPSSEGCGCRVPSSRGGAEPSVALALLALVARITARRRA